MISIKLNNHRISSLFASLLIVLLVSLSCYPLMTNVGGSSFDDVVSVSNAVNRAVIDNAARDMSVDFALRSDIEPDGPLGISADKPMARMSYSQGEFSSLTEASDIYANEHTFDDVVSVGDEIELRAVINNATLGIPVNVALKCDITLSESLVISADKHIVLMSDGMDEFFRLIGASGTDTLIIDSGGVLELAGINVTHPSTTTGRGVLVCPGATLTMYYGEISGNTVTSDGGGVYNLGDFTMSGGAILGNVARFGGGVLNDGGSFTMSGGVLFENSASYSGGGVYSESGDFTMSAGMILGNTAVGNGGGVFLSSGSLSLFDGSISGNTARSGDGGGVYNWNGNFTIFGGGMILGNSARFGGGVFNDAGSFTVSGGIISRNSVSYNGGGVYSVAGDFTIFDCAIYGNAARVGGGVFLDSCSSALFDGVISNNRADSGGGVVIFGAAFDLFGGVISNNTATYGGGIYTRFGNFSMFGGEISSNTGDVGGGIYFESGVVDLFGGMVLENTSINDGGGIWIALEDLDKLCIYDGVIFSNNSASMSYERAPEHDAIYHAQIGANVRTCIQ